MPVGGESTHTVLTGHRGLPTKTLFTNMDKLKVGDIFYIKVLGETLAYKIDQGRIMRHLLHVPHMRLIRTVSWYVENVFHMKRQ